MPELPEVETVRRTLAARVVGCRVVRVTVRRADVVRGDARLLCRVGVIVDVLRHGKQLALAFEDGRRVCVHLGMSGSMCVLASESAKPPLGRELGAERQAAGHEHVVWRLAGGGELVFRDPRRFGGVWVYDGHAALVAARWSKLGPDALDVTARHLREALSRKRRAAVKAALLDQSVVAGLGNIYVDEALFRCRVWPGTRAGDLDTDTVGRLVVSFKRVLRDAIRHKGSSLRDYVDGNGERGGFQARHKVYGRAGQSCVVCRAALASFLLAGRTTVACPACQPLGRAPLRG